MDKPLVIFLVQEAFKGAEASISNELEVTKLPLKQSVETDKLSIISFPTNLSEDDIWERGCFLPQLSRNRFISSNEILRSHESKYDIQIGRNP